MFITWDTHKHIVIVNPGVNSSVLPLLLWQSPGRQASTESETDSTLAIHSKLASGWSLNLWDLEFETDYKHNLSTVTHFWDWKDSALIFVKSPQTVSKVRHLASQCGESIWSVSGCIFVTSCTFYADQVDGAAFLCPTMLWFCFYSTFCNQLITQNIHFFYSNCGINAQVIKNI